MPSGCRVGWRLGVVWMSSVVSVVAYRGFLGVSLFRAAVWACVPLGAFVCFVGLLRRGVEMLSRTVNVLLRNVVVWLQCVGWCVRGDGDLLRGVASRCLLVSAVRGAAAALLFVAAGCWFVS